MDKELAVFSDNRFGSVRMIEINGEPWFVAKDISDALNYDTASHMVRILDDDEKGRHKVDTLGGSQIVTIINESGIYHAVLLSKKPEAKEFRKWVTSEVIPSIRTNGTYSVKDKNGNYALTRKKSKEIRNDFTESLKNHGYTKSYEYINTTRDMKKPLNITVKKEEMTEMELVAIATAESMAKLLMYDKSGYKEVNPVCRHASEIVANAITESKTERIA